MIRVLWLSLYPVVVCSGMFAGRAGLWVFLGSW